MEKVTVRKVYLVIEADGMVWAFSNKKFAWMALQEMLGRMILTPDYLKMHYSKLCALDREQEALNIRLTDPEGRWVTFQSRTINDFDDLKGSKTFQPHPGSGTRSRDRGHYSREQRG